MFDPLPRPVCSAAAGVVAPPAAAASPAAAAAPRAARRRELGALLLQGRDAQATGAQLLAAREAMEVQKGW